MIQALVAALIAFGAFYAGYSYKTCPPPTPDPAPVIQEVEKIRYVDKIVVKEVIKRVDRIIKEPFYTGACFDDDGVHALNSLIQGSAAGRPDLRRTASPVAHERAP